MQINFADIPWSISQDESKSLLKEKGFKSEKCDDDTVYASGSLLSLNFTSYLRFDSDGLSEVSLQLQAGDDYWATFERVKNILTKKYNNPDSGDDYYSAWSDTEGNTLSLMNDKDYEVVYIIYYAKRKAEALTEEIMKQTRDEEASAEDLL